MATNIVRWTNFFPGKTRGAEISMTSRRQKLMFFFLMRTGSSRTRTAIAVCVMVLVMANPLWAAAPGTPCNSTGALGSGVGGLLAAGLYEQAGRNSGGLAGCCNWRGCVAAAYMAANCRLAGKMHCRIDGFGNHI